MKKINKIKHKMACLIESSFSSEAEELKKLTQESSKVEISKDYLFLLIFDVFLIKNIHIYTQTNYIIYFYISYNP